MVGEKKVDIKYTLELTDEEMNTIAIAVASSLSNSIFASSTRYTDGSTNGVPVIYNTHDEARFNIFSRSLLKLAGIKHTGG